MNNTVVENNETHGDKPKTDSHGKGFSLLAPKKTPKRILGKPDHQVEKGIID